MSLSACGGGGGGGGGGAAVESPPDPGPGPAPPAPSSKGFTNLTPATGISYFVGYTAPYVEKSDVLESTFGGAAAGDCDGDGDIDLFITYGDSAAPNGGGGPNRLYLNQLAESGNGLLFQDNAETAGVANTRPDGLNDRHSGPTFADMDGDGDLDLFIGGLFGDPNKLYANRGDCTFDDVTANSPELVAIRAPHTFSAGFGDYDLDGDLDMFLTHWGTMDSEYGELGTPEADYLWTRTRETDHLWQNVSDESGIRFINASEESGISDVIWATRDYPATSQDGDATFTATFARIDADLWPDIAIAADFGTTQLALSNGDGTYRNFDDPIIRDVQYGMGQALGDFDADGDLDWFVTSIFGPGNDIITPWGNRLYRNVGGAALLRDDSEFLNVANGGWGWAACFIDIDNDGDLDIFHTNGWSNRFLGPGEQYFQDNSRAFILGDDGRFTDQGVELGVADGSSGRGAVCADFDHDGDVDILELTDSANNSARLWENRIAGPGTNALRVRLVGLPPNTEAAGARILVRIGNREQMREIMIGSNYTSQNPTVQLFGLGTATVIDELRVEWPPIDSGGGAVQPAPTVLTGVVASQPGDTLTIPHPDLP